jgi:hypothetical protein
MLYYKFIYVNRWQKIDSGQRKTSFSWLLNDKAGMIGKMLNAIKVSQLRSGPKEFHVVFISCV